MSTRYRDTDLSELELEFELEMDDLEADEEMEEDLEYYFGDSEFEEDIQGESEADEEESDYADRFYELSQMEFESSQELEEEITGVLNEMAEHFFGQGLLKKAGKWGYKYARNKLNIPSVRMLTKLLGSVGLPLMSRVLAATPQGAAALAAIRMLQGSSREATDDTEVDREVWDNYVQVCKEAYEHLADQIGSNEGANDPLVAAELANEAFQTAFRTARRRGPYRPRFNVVRDNRAITPRRSARLEVIYQHVLGPGQRVIVTGKRVYIVRKR